MPQLRDKSIVLSYKTLIVTTILSNLTIFIGVKTLQAAPLNCCQPTSSPTNSTNSTDVSLGPSSTASPWAAAVIGSGGCLMSVLDESFQPYYSNVAPGPSPMLGNLVQSSITNNQAAQTGSSTIGLDCQYITSDQLHDKFNRIRTSGSRVSSLSVKDSNLTTLGNLPQGFNELKRLSISNTSIDLEVLKEGSESLDQLMILEITNEKISNIPQNFFQEMQSLRELRLENDEIASLDGDAFHNLDDSLEVLVLRRNRFNRFPMAVKNLAQLAVLDLSDNDIVIDTQDNDLPEKLEPLMNLRELVMNRINCTCEFSSSPFFEWIARTHISGVRCFAPEKFMLKEVIVFERDEFCVRHSGTSSIHHDIPMILYLSPLMGTFMSTLQFIKILLQNQHQVYRTAKKSH